MPLLKVSRFRKFVLSQAQSIKARMEADGESDGSYNGESSVIDAWFGTFHMLLLFFAGGCRPCTTAVVKQADDDGAALVVGGQEKTRRITRRLYAAEGELHSRLEPYFNFFGEVKTFVKFHFEGPRKWCIANLKRKANSVQWEGDWKVKLTDLGRNLPTQAIFNTATGESLSASQQTKNVRYFAKKSKLFNANDIEQREGTMGGRQVKYFAVAPRLRKQLSCRGMRRAIATGMAMDFKSGRIGKKPDGDRMNDTEFLCALATVFNTSVAVLCHSYIQCSFGTWETDQNAWACVYMDASGDNIGKHRLEQTADVEIMWDFPRWDENADDGEDLVECESGEDEDDMDEIEPGE